MGVLGSGVTLTNLTGNIFEANTADNTLSSATNDGDGGMEGPAAHHASCSSTTCIMHKLQTHLVQTVCLYCHPDAFFFEETNCAAFTHYVTHMRTSSPSSEGYKRTTSAVTHAGAVNIEGGAVALTTNTFHSNVATQYGGAIFYSQGCIATHTIPGRQCASRLLQHVFSTGKTALAASAP